MKDDTQKQEVSAMLPAVLDGEPWIERFSWGGYDAAFRDYVECFGPVWMSAVRSAGEAGLPALAEALLDGMEAHWAAQRIWNRGVARHNAQQMLVGYLSPMLLGLEEPGCKALAGLIRDGWAVRRPKEAYQTASYKRISSGFRRAIFGIPLPDKRKEAKEAAEEPED